MKFKDLSSNIVTIMEEILKNDRLVKLIYYDDSTPFDEPNLDDITKNSLIMTRVFPIPAEPSTFIEQHTEVRIFFPQGEIKNRKILDNVVVFQIISHKNVWLIKEGVEKLIRPYEIMHEIVETFENRSIDKLGILHFMDYRFIYVNKEASGFELYAKMMTLGDG